MLCSGVWACAPVEFSLLTFKNRPLQICTHVQSCMSLEKERIKKIKRGAHVCVFVGACSSVCVFACFDECKWWGMSLYFLLGCLFCRLLCSHEERPLHGNEKRQRREYCSRLWLCLAGSVRPAPPRWQSPYFWEDGPVIGLVHFTPFFV